MNPKGKLTRATPDEIKEFNKLRINYRAIVGALNYLSCTTRPDITFAVSSLSQFLNEPGILHWQACVQVLQYLKGTRNFTLRINKPNQENELIAYADADWGNCLDTRRSVSGSLIVWNGNIISWKSRKQPTVSLSSTEAEYKSICDTTKELMWIKTLLKKIFNMKNLTPITVFEDNQGAIDLAKNDSNHSNFKTKHMSLKFHFIRREIKIKHIKLEYIKTNDMLADFLTKPVGRTSIKRALTIINP